MGRDGGSIEGAARGRWRVTERCDLTAERHVLAAILLEPGCFTAARARLTAESFHSPAHATLWQAFEAIIARNEPLDGVTLPAQLKRMNRINAVGGEHGIRDLWHDVVTAAHVEAHIAIVADHAVARRVAHAAAEVLARANDHKWSAADVASLAQTRFSDAVAGGRKGLKTMLDLALEVSLELERPFVPGLLSGLADLDELTTGFYPSQLWVLAAVTGGGKSSFALNFAARQARNGKGVLFFAQEMSGRELVTRLACGEAGIDSRLFRTRRFSQRQIDEFTAKLNDLTLLPIEVEDSGGATVEDITAHTMALRQMGRPPALVVVDYIQILAVTDAKAPRVQQLEHITRSLKRLAQSADCTVLALSQFSREGVKGGGRPALHHLKGAGSIESDADGVLFLHPCEKQPEKSVMGVHVDAVVAKNRGGPSGVAPLLFDKQHTLFASCQPGDPRREVCAGQQVEEDQQAPRNGSPVPFSEFDDFDGDVPFGVTHAAE